MSDDRKIIQFQGKPKTEVGGFVIGGKYPYKGCLHAILARDPNGLIGKNNIMAWTIKDELELFKAVLSAYDCIIVGMNTWRHLHYLGKQEILIDREHGMEDTFKSNLSFELGAQVVRVKSYDKVKPTCMNAKALVIGGASLILTALEDITTFHMSEIKKEYEGDCWFTDKLEGFMLEQSIDRPEFVYNRYVRPVDLEVKS